MACAMIDGGAADAVAVDIARSVVVRTGVVLPRPLTRVRPSGRLM